VNLFINDVHVWLAKPGEMMESDLFNFTIDCEKERITKAKLIHHVWLKNAGNENLDKLMELLNSRIIHNLLSVTVTALDYEALKLHFKSKFKVVKAAGGVVKKRNHVLMINRLRKWDLPKGKINKGELPEEGALREVEEECNIKVALKKKICNTWHTYTLKKRPILKKTTWFSMTLLDESEMRPQVEEDITEIKWMSPKEKTHALEESYQSIRYVLDKYHKRDKVIK